MSCSWLAVEMNASRHGDDGTQNTLHSPLNPSHTHTSHSTWTRSGRLSAEAALLRDLLPRHLLLQPPHLPRTTTSPPLLLLSCLCPSVFSFSSCSFFSSTRSSSMSTRPWPAAAAIPAAPLHQCLPYLDMMDLGRLVLTCRRLREATQAFIR